MSEKKTDEDLLKSLIGVPPTDARFRHYKTGGIYRVICGVILEATQEPLVIYKSMTGPVCFARPLGEFTGAVLHDGRMVPRFEDVTSEPGAA